MRDRLSAPALTMREEPARGRGVCVSRSYLVVSYVDGATDIDFPGLTAIIKRE
jgi:hypothetical protein